MKVHIDGITKCFGSHTALDHLSISFEDGKLTTLLGPSGCGKSTLLNIISGILLPTDGKVFFGEQDVTSLAPEKRNVGLVFQNYALYPHMTVRENICFPLENKKVPKSQWKERSDRLAQMLRISEYMGRKPSQLSGGQQQRVAIARALAKEPSILLLDEPLSNLDARLRIEMREEIRRIQIETGLTTIFVTHDQEEAMSISDHVLLLRNGKKQQYGTAQQLYDNPQNAFVADFLGTPPINMHKMRVESDGIVLDDGSAMLKYGEVRSLPSGQLVQGGIRAECLEVGSEENGAPAHIKGVFLNGKETLYVVQIGSWSLRCIFDSHYRFKMGDTIFLRIRPQGLYLFDPESGDRLL